MTEIGELLDRLRADQRSRWQLGESIYIETYLDECPQLRADAHAVLDLIGNEIVLRRERGDDPTLEEYLHRFQDLEALLRQWFHTHPADHDFLSTQRLSDSRLKLTAASLFAAEQTEGPLPDVADYQVLSELGRGGMGVVYKARHKRLKRIVA